MAETKSHPVSGPVWTNVAAEGRAGAGKVNSALTLFVPQSKAKTRPTSNGTGPPGVFTPPAAALAAATGAVSGSYVVSQGRRLGRAGEIVIDVDADGTVWVGGATTTCFRGSAIG